MVDRDTTMCISLAARPGNHGNRFHNFLYAELGLNYLYKSFSSTDIGATIGGIRSLGIRGASVSMPYKESCIPFLDALEDSARAIDSVNTIVNDGGRLTGLNTDFIAVRSLLDEHGIPSTASFALLGAGGMAKAVLAALVDAGLRDGVVLAPTNPQRGARLAGRYGVETDTELGSRRPALLVNATPLGMSGGPEAGTLAFDAAAVAAADYVFDVVYLPADTPLVDLARAEGKTVITGDQVMVRQAKEQFELYTGVAPTPEQIARAELFSADPAAYLASHQL
ncbi:shikimate 5-dehydrogenase [Microbacterium sp.]|uniref:shikimate 5-dehydrogenase n=1 Tax=Microbacterium sp. TaxID=51671 RepID=UPI0039E5F15D